MELGRENEKKRVYKATSPCTQNGMRWEWQLLRTVGALYNKRSLKPHCLTGLELLSTPPKSSLLG